MTLPKAWSDLVLCIGLWKVPVLPRHIRLHAFFSRGGDFTLGHRIEKLGEKLTFSHQLKSFKNEFD